MCFVCLYLSYFQHMPVLHMPVCVCVSVPLTLLCLSYFCVGLINLAKCVCPILAFIFTRHAHFPCLYQMSCISMAAWSMVNGLHRSAFCQSFTMTAALLSEIFDLGSTFLMHLSLLCPQAIVGHGGDLTN